MHGGRVSRPLRSLSGLLDFEAAARWGSFKLAAQELHKTPAAVSQQVKHLEDGVGFALFMRHPRHVALTEKGQELAVAVTKMVGDLRAKVDALQGGDEEKILRISTTHSLAIKWLVPRMHRFTKLYPDLDIRLDSNDAKVNMDDDSTDVAIRYGPLGQDDALLLFRERLVIVYSPELIPPGRTELTLADLPDYPLLYEVTTEGWMQVLRENRILKAKVDFSRSYSHWGVLAQAAVAGQGIALVAYGIAYQDILKGALCLMKCKSAPFDRGYRLLVNRAKEGMPKITRFRAWIASEMNEMEKSLGPRSR